ncbi:host cell division inhibitor Icd-like protein [Providencia rettgeri]|nr:host cell division inhibitor Icd-like protein [Providencia rettgeri]
MIAYQESDSLLAGMGVSLIYSLNNTVTLTYGITGNQSDKLSSGYLANILAQHSANILAQQLAKTLADVSAKIYANQSPKFTGNQSGEYFSGCKSGEYLSTPKRGSAKGGEFTPFAKGDFSHLSKVGKSRYLNSFISKNGKIEFYESIKGKIIEFFESIKKGSQSATLGNVDIKYRASENYQHSDHFVIGKDNNLGLIQKCAIHHLRLWVIVGYSKNALAKSSVRIGVLNLYKATHDAPSVFFCVHAYAHLLNAVLYRTESMVAAAEQPKGWLVSLYASNANSTVVTTPEIGVSGGDSLALYKEIIVMMATPTQTQFKFLFLAVKRTDKTDIPHRIEATASNEHDARLMLVRDYILSFAGRLPAIGGKHHA